MFKTSYHSPIGVLTLAADDKGLRHILFPEGKNTRQVATKWQKRDSGFEHIIRELDEYFDGTRRQFSVQLNAQGTDFQQSVWNELQRVGYGDICNYGTIAKNIGRPKASRAVGAANGANPIPIIIPCHRIIGANGKLTGFSGGLAIKQWLLAHEQGEQQLF